MADPDPEVVFATFDGLKDVSGPIGTIIAQIGERGALTSDRASVAATAIVDARRIYPDATLTLCMDGYDDDPREIWQVPEAKAFVRRVMAEVFAALGRDAMDRLNLDPQTNALVGVCLGALRVTGRDPATGDYTMEPVGR
jgi:hypothetical protein